MSLFVGGASKIRAPMPNRIIRESAITSPTLDQLSDGAERMFWRMTVVADDHGRFEADPRILLSRCFPLKAQIIKLKQIEQWFTELVSCGLVTAYAVNGKMYGLFITWAKHQRIRAKESKYPPPSSADICQQMMANVPEESRNRGIEESRNRESDATGSGRQLPTPSSIQFRINAAILSALDRSVHLGKVPKLRDPAWWQAQVRAVGHVDFAQELLKAEAYLVTKGPQLYRDKARFVHNWFARVPRPEGEGDG